MTFDWRAAAPWVLLPFAGSIPGSLLTKKNIPGWYEGLKKPNWRPPNWAFGPVWTSLYLGMGYASYLVYRDGGGFGGAAKLPLVLYGTQLALNWAWTPIFFGAHKLKLAFYEILLLWGSIAATTVAFHGVSPLASYLMLPYQAWVTLASVLTYNIMKNNKEKDE